MVRLRSTLRHLQESNNIFVAPRGALARQDAIAVEFVGDLPQRLAGFPQPLNPLQNRLLARLRFHMLAIRRQPEAIGRIADVLELRLLVPRSEEHTSELQSPCNLVRSL